MITLFTGMQDSLCEIFSMCYGETIFDLLSVALRYMGSCRGM